MTNANIVIRPAIASDARKLNQYVRHIFETSEHLITRPHEFRTGTFRQRLWITGKAANPYETCLIATAGSDIIGLIDSWTDRRERVKHVTTLVMSVHPDWHGQGLGTQLLTSFIDWVRDNPRLEKIQLHVHADNQQAIALYKKCGFEQEGVRKRAVRYNKNDFTDDIIMAYWPNSSDVENIEGE